MNITEITQGASYSWCEEPCNYLPSAGWSMTFYFRGVGPGLNLDGTVDGKSFSFALSASQTAAFTDGAYTWQSYAIKDSEKILIGEGNLTIRKGFSALNESETIDNRSDIKIALDNINAVIENRATDGVFDYMIGNRRLRRYQMTELIELRKLYQKLYNQEKINAARKKGKSIFKTYLGKVTSR